jgi:hypothetical protein
MRKLGLWAVGPKPDTSKPHPQHKVYPYLLRGMVIDRPNQVWATDITAGGKLVFGIFAVLAEFERELITERTVAGLASARARGRKGGRPFKMTAAKLRLVMAAMGQPETKVGDLCQELGITRQTLYRHISPKGALRPDGEKLFGRLG